MFYLSLAFQIYGKGAFQSQYGTQNLTLLENNNTKFPSSKRNQARKKSIGFKTMASKTLKEI